MAAKCCSSGCDSTQCESLLLSGIRLSKEGGLIPCMAGIGRHNKWLLTDISTLTMLLTIFSCERGH